MPQVQDLINESMLFMELDRYSEKYGDQALIDAVKNWLHSRMGGEYLVQKKDSK